MTRKRFSRALGAGAVLLLLAGAQTPAIAADLASTYAHDAFPLAEPPAAVKTPSAPCPHARPARHARAARRTAPAAVRGSGTRGDAPVPERGSGQHASAPLVVDHPDENPFPAEPLTR
jgi:hypothetical protein